jgi:hypothetical protein
MVNFRVGKILNFSAKDPLRVSIVPNFLMDMSWTLNYA